MEPRDFPISVENLENFGTSIAILAFILSTTEITLDREQNLESSKDNANPNRDATNEDEQSLIRDAVHDPEALTRLYSYHYAAIHKYVQRRVGNAHDTNDIVGEAFVAMVRYLPKYRWTGAPFRAWLFRIANSQVNRWVRRQKWTRFWQPINEQELEIHSTQSTCNDRVELVRKMVLDLPIRFQSVIALHYFEDMPIEMISEVLQCPQGTVKSRLSRGRELLRESLTLHEQRSQHERRTIGSHA